MPESILSSSLIKLYGRTITEIQLNPGGGGIGAGLQNLGANRFLRAQLTAANANLARIYGFSFEGHYYDLPRPVIMLVHGAGVAVNAPPTIDDTNEAGRDWEFAVGLNYWEYDKDDFSLRLDVESGPLTQILLDATLGADPLGSYAGASARLSGASARVSGASARLSGASARLSGASARLRRGDWD
jgi:hypothetical protein